MSYLGEPIYNPLRYDEKVSEIRKAARQAGLTFKKQNARINGKQAWMFVDRYSGGAVLKNCTVDSAYNQVCSGFIGTYDNEKRIFKG